MAVVGRLAGALTKVRGHQVDRTKLYPTPDQPTNRRKTNKGPVPDLMTAAGQALSTARTSESFGIAERMPGRFWPKTKVTDKTSNLSVTD